MSCGIYKLYFTSTNKVYIGQSVNIERRFKEHLNSMLNQDCSGRLLQAFSTFGLPELEILIECSKEELNTLEKEAIEIYNSFHGGFNSTIGGTYTLWENGALKGQNNPNSKYSNEQIEKAFNLLLNKQLSYLDIEKITKVSQIVLRNISSGSSHIWLKDIYPQEYLLLITNKNKRKSSINRDRILESPNKKLVTIRGSLTDFCKVYPELKISGLSMLLNKKIPIYKGWTVFI